MMTTNEAFRVLCVVVFMVTDIQGNVDCGNCDTSGHGPGCDVRSIERCMCPADPYCCATDWDGVCARAVQTVCGIDCANLGECPYEMDGNLEVLFPPLIDDAKTHVEFMGSSSYMKVSIMVPKQYSTAKINFEGATNPAASYDSTNNTFDHPFWIVDALTDNCNTIYYGRIPWLDFRTSLGGMSERRYHDAVYYNTAINIEVTKNLTLDPHAHSLLSEEDGEATLMQKSDYTQEHVRYVQNKIPFEIHFDLTMKLSDNTEVRSDHLRVAAAIIDSSVLNVDPDFVPIAKAQLDFVTVIPLPLLLSAPTIFVNMDALATGITIEELVTLRDCNEEQAICTQTWHVMTYPEQCTLNGQYIANLTGVCHPSSRNCIAPEPNFAEIVMDVTSDDFCGVTQEVDIEGSLTVGATDCNGILKGTVRVANPEGAAINRTEIVKVDVSPPLVGSSILSVFDKPTAILDYTAVLTQPDQVDFEFVWSGNELRCDVIASIDVKVMVEFEATRSLQVLSLNANAQTSRSQPQAKKAAGENGHYHERDMLQERQGTNDYEMRMVTHASIRRDTAAGSVSPDDATDATDANGPVTGSGVGGNATGPSSAVLTAIYVLAAIFGVVALFGAVACVRARRQKRAAEGEVPGNPAAPARGITPRNAAAPKKPQLHGGHHHRTLSRAVMARVGAISEEERTPLATPIGVNDHFFSD